MMTFLTTLQKYAVLLSWIVMIGFLSGCGGDGADTLNERISGPASNAALPIRVDATPEIAATASPTPTALSADQTPQPDKKSTPSAQQTVTPTPDAKNNASTAEKTPLPQTTPTPALIPSPDEKTASEEESSATQEEESAQEDAEAEDEDAAGAESEQEESDGTIVTAKGVKLEKFVVCSAVKNRNASGVANEFSRKKVKKIYVWTKVSGIKTPTVLKHHYYLNGKKVETVKLTLKYSAMRSWSHKALTSGESIGRWKVVITTENDKDILAEQEFTVVK